MTDTLLVLHEYTVARIQLGVPVVDNQTITETVTVNGVIPWIFYDEVSESVISSSGYVTTIHGNNTLIDLVALGDAVRLSFPVAVASGVVAAASAAYVVNKLELIVEDLIAHGSVSTKLTALNALVSLARIVDATDRAAHQVVNDSVGVHDVSIALLEAIVSIASSISVVPSTSQQYVHVVSLSSSIVADDAVGSTKHIFELLRDGMILAIGGVDGTESYLAFALVPEIMAVTNYTNFDFRAATKYNGEYLFAGKNGLFRHGSTKDAGEDITAVAQTPALDFGVAALKRCTNAYIGVSRTKNLYLKVTTDRGQSATYRVQAVPAPAQNEKVSIGYGLSGRYFQFEVVTSADEFELNSLEFFPIELSRRI